MAKHFAASGATVVLTACDTPRLEAAHAGLSGEYLCQYTQSQFGYLLDFDRPDIVLWGGVVPESYVDGLAGIRQDDRGRVEVTTPLQSNAVGQLTYSGPAQNVETYTIIRTGLGELRLKLNPASYSRDEDGPDPVPLCVSYVERVAP